jgi:ABC-type antimicrobial peptide transport system permease subunit
MLVFQFTLSLGFIMSVMIAFSQYRETLRFNFGFEQENILDVRLQSANPKLFRNEFTRLASVQHLSMASDIVGTGGLPVEWIRKGGEADSSEVNVLSIDENYLANLGLTLAAGRNFTPSSVGREIIVNETWVKNHAGGQLSDALGMEILLDKRVTVKGVVKDFHYAPLNESIGNLVMVYEPDDFRYANLRVKSGDIFGMIAGMETVWKTIGGEEKFEARFFDDELEEAYSFHFSLIKICGFLGLLAISISCLGMLGMVAFNVENRVKEIGIRKVMGATSTSLTLLLSNEFIRLMLWATPIAVPLTYLFFDNVYLSRQAYKIPIGWFEIVSSLLVLFVLGLSAVLSQTLRAAQSNPVDVLRTE